MPAQSTSEAAMGGWSGNPRARLALDVGAALLYLLVFGLPVGGERGWELAAHLAATTVIVAGMLLRWRFPALSFAAVAGSTAMGTAVGWGGLPDPFMAAAWTLYPLAVRRGPGSSRMRWAVTTVLAVAAPALLLSGITGANPALARVIELVGYTLLSVLLLAGSWMLGVTVQRWRLQARRTAQAAAEAAAAEERLRIAREMHDVLAHSLGTIGVRAGVARHITADGDERLRELLGEIERTSRSAVRELRSLLGTLRAHETVPPWPRLGTPVDSTALDGLAATARAAGVSCSLELSGTERLDDAEGLTVYRIVQEALTNVVRHAPGARCGVTVTVTPEGTRIEVVDDGPGDTGAETPGHGLIGMRERVLSHGGRFHAGNRPGGGFAVHAWLPAAQEGGNDGRAG